MKKMPDLVVWSEENGYDANIRSYPTNLSSFPFKLPEISITKYDKVKDVVDKFELEKTEILNNLKKLYSQYYDTIMVWQSKISFVPKVGKIYYLYHFGDEYQLSLISPDEWNRKNEYVGAFLLNHDNKWIRQ